MLGELVRVHTTDGDEIGVCDAPAPGEAGDVVSVDGELWRIVRVIVLPADSVYDVAAMAEPSLRR